MPTTETTRRGELIAGTVPAGIQAQATLVALPYQLYIETRSAFLVGLPGAVELLPVVASALLGGAIADRVGNPGPAAFPALTRYGMKP